MSKKDKPLLKKIQIIEATELRNVLNAKGIVLFDGYCNLCSWSVQFILKRDKNDYFRFASIQSEIGRQLLVDLKLTQYSDKSVIFIEKDFCYLKSDAALRIAKKLCCWWYMIYFFKIIPRPLRDFVYLTISKNRFKWFGKRDSCYLPESKVSYKFL